MLVHLIAIPVPFPVVKAYFVTRSVSLEGENIQFVFPRYSTSVSILEKPKALNEMKRKIILPAPSEIWQPLYTFFGNPEL